MSRRNNLTERVPQRFGRLSTCAILLALLLPVVARAQVRELGLPPAQYRLHTDIRSIEGKRLELPRGAFSFAPLGKVIGTGARRTIVEAGAHFEPGSPWIELTPTRNIVGMRSLERKPVGRTALDILAIEVIENGRTVALVETSALLDANRNRRSWPVGVDVENWDGVEILYHVRLTQDDPGRSTIPELPAEGRATLRWKPSAFLLSVEAARDRGRPPRPAELRTLAAGLVIYPPEPFIDDTFTATIVLQNAGDLPSPPRLLHWAYGAETATTELPPLPGGATASLHFSAVAREDDDRVTLDLGERLLQADFEPLRRPVLRLLNAEPERNFSDEPLVTRVAIANTGSGASLGASLSISTGEAETIVILPNLAPRRSHTIPITWRRTFKEPETVTVELRDDNRSLGAITFRLDRPHRPRPAFSILSVELEGERGAGNPGRVRARVRNHGDLAGSLDLELAVIHTSSGRVLGSRTVTREINAGEDREFFSEAVAQEPGLLKIQARMGDTIEFEHIDVPPPPAITEETAVELFPGPLTDQAPPGAAIRGGGGTASSPGAAPEITVTRLIRPLEFRFQPLTALEEIDSAVHLVLRTASWRNQNGVMVPAVHDEPRATIRVTISGGGETPPASGAWRDRFEIASSEPVFTYPVARHLLADTLVILVEPVASAGPAFLIGTPRLLASLSAPQNGRIDSVRVTESGVYCVVRNRGRRIRSPFVTAAILEEHGRALHASVRVGPGERARIFLPTELRAPGRHAIVVSLPMSPSPDARTVEQFIAPVPFPRLGFAAVLGARSPRTGDAGTLALVPVTRADAPDLRLRALVGSRIGDTFEFDRVHASETVAIWVPGADGMLIDYGPVQTPERATPAPSHRPASRLRILDFGGDTPALRGDVIVRYVRSAGGETLPATRVWLAVNRQLRASRAVPALGPGERYFDAFRLAPAVSRDLTTLIFEHEDGSPAEASARAIVDELAIRLAAEGAAPSRGDRDWTRVVHVRGPRLPPGDPYLRASDAAWEAAKFLAEDDLADLPPVTPEPARELARLVADTSAAGRIAYREALSRLVEEWRTAGMLLSGARLPITAEPAHLADFLAAGADLDAMAGHPAPIDRARVERTLDRLAASVELLLGLRVEIILP